MKKEKANILLANVRETYDSIADQFSNSRMGKYHELPDFGDYLTGEKSILDIGCGNGRLINYLAGHITPEKALEKNYTGIDNSIKLLELAKKLHPGYRFVYGDQLQIPIKSNSCDIIFNVRAFHHIPSSSLRKDAVIEMKRVMRTDGILIITVWNLWQFKYLMNILSAFLRSILTFGRYDFNDLEVRWGKSGKRYYHAFTRRELISTVKCSGLKIIDVKSLGKDHLLIAKKI